MAPLSAAEKQKRYRDRMRQSNPEKFSEVLKNNAVRNRKYREKIKKGLVEEKIIEQRLKWRENKRQERRKRKGSSLNENSDGPLDNQQEKSIDLKIKRERKKIYRMWIAKKTKYERRIKLLSNKIDKLRKRNNRLTQKNTQLQKLLLLQSEEKNTTPKINQNVTPLSKTCSFIEDNLPNITNEEKDKVKRVLLEHNILTNVIQNAYKDTKSNDERNIFKKMTENEVVKKYRKKRKLTFILGLKGRARRNKAYTVRRYKKMVEEIQQFYERDDVSRATAGKKEVKTSKKIKRQRRYLLKTLKDIYKQYKNEGGKAKFSSFKKHKPFYVLRPKLSDRDTCGCIKHENFKLKTDKLFASGLIDTKNFDEILTRVVCDLNSKECAYGDCATCCNKDIIFDWDAHSRDEVVTWEEFVREKHEYVDKSDGTNKTTEKIVKKGIHSTMVELTNLYNNDLNTLKKHVYNIKHQYSQYLSCINNLTVHEVAVHIDFSENYTCKLSKEVQSMHWGGSKPQITIHTGVLYTKQRQPQTFASISPNNEHGPEAIWAHLEPVLVYVRTEFPNVIGVHFFSDGPTSQYKQKKNFYLFSKLTKEKGFPYSTWNFSEASHGKGAADGVGAAIKRRLDNVVSQGVDIPNAEKAYEVLQKSDTTILIFYISEDAIKAYSVKENLIPVPQTMSLHQIVNNTDSSELQNCIKFRCLSCFCFNTTTETFKGFCDCLNIKTHVLYNKQELKNNKRKGDNNSEKKSIEKKMKITNKENVSNKNKVTILSDVTFLPENRGFTDLTNFFGPELTTISKNYDISTGKHNKNTKNIYDNPIPSTSKEGLRQIKKKYPKKFKRNEPASNDDTTDTDDEIFSLHDSSDYCVDDDEQRLEEFARDFYDHESELMQNIIENEETKNQVLDQIEQESESRIMETENRVQIEENKIMTTENNTIEEENKTKQTVDLVQIKVENNTKKTENLVEVENRIMEITHRVQREEENKKCNNIQTGGQKEARMFREKETNYTENNEGDSVIVKYYEKKSWKFYVGFIENVASEEVETFYCINFLKTVNNPLKFVKPKKVDRDIVPTTNIVKKVQLIFSSTSKEYFLYNESSDRVYFV